MNLKQYLLICLMEECNEVAHAASKMLRFTEHDSPVIGGITNCQNLQKEFNELLAVVDLLTKHSIHLHRDENIIAMKKKRLADYAHYSKLLGVIDVGID